MVNYNYFITSCYFNPKAIIYCIFDILTYKLKIKINQSIQFKSTSKKSELEERLNDIFGDDAPGFQKSTVISTNKDGETFTADVLERIYTDFVHVD